MFTNHDSRSALRPAFNHCGTFARKMASEEGESCAMVPRFFISLLAAFGISTRWLPRRYKRSSSWHVGKRELPSVPNDDHGFGSIETSHRAERGIDHIPCQIKLPLEEPSPSFQSTPIYSFAPCKGARAYQTSEYDSHKLMNIRSQRPGPTNVSLTQASRRASHPGCLLSRRPRPAARRRLQRNCVVETVSNTAANLKSALR